MFCYRLVLLPFLFSCVAALHVSSAEQVYPRDQRSSARMTSWERKPIDKRRQVHQRTVALFDDGPFGGDLKDVEKQADSQVKCKTLSSIYYALLEVHEEYVSKTPVVNAEVTADAKIPPELQKGTKEYVKTVYGTALYYLRHNDLELSQSELKELAFDYSDWSGYSYELTPELAKQIEKEVDVQFNNAALLEVCSDKSEFDYIQKVFKHAQELLEDS